MRKERIAPIVLQFLPLFMLIALFLISVIGLPHAILYVMDLLNGLVLLFSVKRLLSSGEKRVRQVTLYLGIFFLYTLLGFVVSGQSILYYLWGLRNTFRFYAFFLSCLCWLDQGQVPAILRVLELFLYLNVPVCSWQYFLLHLPFDNVCGLFGNTTEGSGYMNVLLVIVTAWSILRCLRRDISLRHFTAIICCCVYIAIISELKVYYFELALIVAAALVLYLLQNRKWSRRLFMAAGICAAGMFFLAVLTVALNPPYWSGFFLPDGIWTEVTRESGYSGSGDLNRLTAIPYLMVHIFGGGARSLLGLGLGNCDFSVFSFLVTPFYRAYQSLHYTWLHSAFLFLETGFLGLLLYLGFFALVGRTAWRNQKDPQRESSSVMYNQLALILCVCCVFFLFYNVCLRTESAYLIFFVLSIPYMQTGHPGGYPHDPEKNSLLLVFRQKYSRGTAALHRLLEKILPRL